MTLELIDKNEENQELFLKKDTCDKYDYLIAVTCGALGGMIDIFLVGAPGDSKLGKWTDEQADNMVKMFAKKSGWKPRQGNEGKVTSAIGHLEKKYRVNYDQTSGISDINKKNHHMRSLAHSPDIVGLFFSILNQFTGTSSLVTKDGLITINSKTKELQGGDFISNIFCGTVNWIGHLFSDFSGSTGSRGNGNRGMGIVIPFYEFFSICNIGSFQVGKDKQDLADVATRAFQEGYDARFGMAMAIPVIITDLLIRLCWSIRRHCQYKYSIRECIPTSKHDSLRVMLIVGNGVLCVMDAIDAGVKSGGNALAFFMRMNIIAWFRFVTMVIKEVCIQLGLNIKKFGYSGAVAAMERVNKALEEYLMLLEAIDIKAFKEESEKYEMFILEIGQIKNEKVMNAFLVKKYNELGLEKPWKGDFDSFMGNSKNHLEFK
ncbi:hypothetical protein [uncultured Eubacterium sp.]|uniref:hypothetical protein n=1 Tax=uncultured Eubacterium sp. TaxID=165185 RepID=UPI002596C5F3|nr:hypothetical protein [uncultured Eubacterium sp.]